MSQYLYMPRMEVMNANAQPAWWIIGPPAMTSYAGFAHALALRCRPDAADIKGPLHSGVAVIHHDAQFLGDRYPEVKGYRYLPHQYRAATFIDKDDYSSKNPHVLAAQPVARLHLTVSLVIRFEDGALLDADTRLPRFLRGGRLAGGTIVNYEKCRFFSDDEFGEFEKIIKSGFSIIERQDLMVKKEGDSDMLDVALRLTRPMTKEEREDAKKEGDDLVWLQPTTLGYVEITKRSSARKNVRNGLRHAYAEPLVGLVQYKTVRKAGLRFWRYTHPRPNVHLVTTN